MFKYLIFVQGLTTKNEKEIHSRRIENDTNITQQKVTEEYQKLINIKQDNKSIENKELGQIQRVKNQHVRCKLKDHCKICGGRTRTTRS